MRCSSPFMVFMLFVVPLSKPFAVNWAKKQKFDSDALRINQRSASC
jgi:hypothetical protein